MEDKDSTVLSVRKTCSVCPVLFSMVVRVYSKRCSVYQREG